MAGVRAGFSGLQGLRRQLREAGDPQFALDLDRVLGAEALKQLADSFRQERDPYGNKWAPLQLRRGKILRDTGRMAASATVRPSPNGFTLSITARYAGTHQTGMTIYPRRARLLRWRANGKWYTARRVVIPRRQMLPAADTGGWGKIWLEGFQRQADAFVRDHFSRHRRGPR